MARPGYERLKTRTYSVGSAVEQFFTKRISYYTHRVFFSLNMY